MVDQRGTSGAYPFIVLQRPGEKDSRNEGRYRAQSAQHMAEIALHLDTMQAQIDALTKRVFALETP